LLAGIALVVGGVCAALLLTELGLRVIPATALAHDLQVADGTAVHPQFGWFNVPGATFVYRTRFVNFNTRVTFNSHGLREREYPYAKRNGVFRVLVLGDSFTASLEVPLEQVWHEVLERSLGQDRSGPIAVEVIGAGVQGWSTDQQLLYYRHEGYRYDADLVVLQFFWDDVRSNDVELLALRNPNFRLLKPYFVLVDGQLVLQNFPYTGRTEETPRSPRGPLGSVRGVLRQRSAAYRLVRNLVLSWRGGRPTPWCYKFHGVPVELGIYSPEEPAEYRRAWALTTRLVEELRREVARRGRRLAVMYFPDRRQVLPQAWEDTLACWPDARTMRWDLDRPNRLLGEALRGASVPYLDLTPPLREHVQRTGQSVFFALDGHFNPDGHRQVAEVVRRWLVENRLVPR
jgi:hypothetical protein